ncbi:hypothetical protein PV797_03670 [Clostridiaceae bacterium M8S5]|nr:hypothetical protein PV797_03670 [Clostridiaceae bacterium M8S5]
MGKRRLLFVIFICCIVLIGYVINTDLNRTAFVETKNRNFENDWNQYLKKMWVIDSGDSSFPKSPPFSIKISKNSSFSISKINNKILEGIFSTGSIAMKQFYFYRRSPSKYLGTLYGKINENVAKCTFTIETGNKGKVTLVLKENDKIKATIKYTNKNKACEDIGLDGEFLFRPYNLKDVGNVTRLDQYSFTVNLNYWGCVNFVAGKTDSGRVIHPVAYLTNENDDIFYDFSVAFKTGTEINDVKIIDKNNDGLKDIVIVTGFGKNSDIDPITFMFIQNKDGSFYSK